MNSVPKSSEVHSISEEYQALPLEEGERADRVRLWLSGKCSPQLPLSLRHFRIGTAGAGEFWEVYFQVLLALPLRLPRLPPAFHSLG